MPSAGSAQFQGMAYRATVLNADGSITAANSTGMVCDDDSLIKVTWKPSKFTGVDAAPVAATGNMLFAYKARDIIKRWDVTVDLGDFDPDKMTVFGGFTQTLSPASAGRTFADGATTSGQPYLTSAAGASFAITDVGRLIVGIPAPTINTPTTSGTGGTLTANTYYYVLTATNASGETIASNEVSITTTGSTSTVTVTWTAVTGATGYNVYRGTAPGTELKVASVGAVTTYTDSAPGTPSGSPPATNTTTPTGIPSGTFVASYQSATQVTMSAPATATGSALSVTLATLPAQTVAVNWPSLLSISGPNGIALEMWSKAITRHSGYQGTTPYPTAGSAVTPAYPSSAYIRMGIFRMYLDPDAGGIENKEGMQSFVGWAIENPMFGLGPMKDWTTTATKGSGVAIPTTAWASAMYDFQLPAVRRAGFQTTST